MAIDKQSKVTTSIVASATGIKRIIDKAKITLGLPNKDIADIFKVTRQTLHCYLNLSDQKNAEQDHNIKDSTRQRAAAINSLITQISARVPRSPGAMAKNYRYNGLTLLALLQAEEIDHSAVLTMTDKLVERMQYNMTITPSTPIKENTLFDLTAVS